MPLSKDLFQAGILGVSTVSHVDRFCPHVKRNTQIALLIENFLHHYNASEAGFVRKRPVRPDDPLDMLVSEETLRPLAGDLAHSIDEEDPAPPLFWFPRPADDHACLHRRVVEEIRPEPQHALDQVRLDQLPPHLCLLLPEEDTVGEEDRTPAGLLVHAARMCCQKA